MHPLDYPCSTRYRAFHSSGTRKRTDVTMIVMHDEEAKTALSAASWFTSPRSGGSAHLCVDDKECYKTLDGADIPWGAASAPQIAANLHGFHIEQAGYAAWSAVIWKKHLNTLKRAAYKAAVWAQVFDIPVVFLDANALIAGKRHGITTHRAVSVASQHLDPAHASRYTHSDPGAGWPTWLFMKYVRQYASELKK